MSINQALNQATKKLQSKNISSTRLDAELLLSFVLKKPREYLLAQGEKKIKPTEQKKYSTLILRRAKYEPVAYLTGYKEFYGLKIKVNKNVLIPRPETELLVEEVTNYVRRVKSSKTAILDMGTGSGAIALALAKNLPKAKIWASDASPDALKIARNNAKALKLKINVIYDNLLKHIKTGLVANAVIAANLPYLDKNEIKNFPPEIKRGLKYEPPSALFATRHGTAIYEELFKQISGLSIKPAILISEIGSYHWRDFMRLAKKYFPRELISIKNDLTARPRILIIKF
jgi:release factor glutamine methyltransferase